MNNICWAFASEGYALDWALDACNRALEAKPEQSRYLSNRALAELRLGQLDRALADYNHSMASNPREARAYYGRAVILSRQGKSESAREDRKRALDLDPSIDEIFEECGLIDFDGAAKSKP
jgi:tetratricopeptide (TPR) repeat protein